MHAALLPLSALVAALAFPALAGPAYTPLPLQPAELVSPPAELSATADALLQAARDGDADAAGAHIAPRVQAVDGALDMHIPRRAEVLGPFESGTAMLSELANYIGGAVEMPPEGEDPTPLRVRAALDYIAASLEYADQWGTDPMMQGALCTYAYRSFDTTRLKALSDQTGVMSSSFVYVDAPYDLGAALDLAAPAVGTLETDRLYALDYDTSAPGRWIAVYLPDGSSGFANFDQVELRKPYASGICFAQDREGRWLMVGQASTSL